MSRAIRIGIWVRLFLARISSSKLVMEIIYSNSSSSSSSSRGIINKRKISTE